MSLPADIDQLLADMQALSEKATPSPWRWRERWTELYGPEDSGHKSPIIETDSGVYGPDRDDAVLIAALRNALPDLLAGVRKLHAERDELAREVARKIAAPYRENAYAASPKDPVSEPPILRFVGNGCYVLIVQGREVCAMQLYSHEADSLQSALRGGRGAP